MPDHSSSNCQSQVWAVLGDSIAEGMTYPLWLTQSVVRAGCPEPYWINAAVGGNTAAQMLARMDRDVLAHHPDFVFFNAGVNDLMVHKNNGVPFTFEKDVDAVLQKLKQAGIPVCVNSTAALAGPMAVHNAELKKQNIYLQKAAEKYGFKFANIFDPFLAGLEAGEPLLSDDNVHLSQEGYQVYVTAVLQAVAPQIPISLPWQPWPEPGIIADWKITADSGKTLDVHLPESGTTNFWWTDQERQRGFVVKLRDRIPGAQTFTARATLHLDSPLKALLKVGGQVSALKVDGKSLPLYPTNLTWGIRAGAHAELGAGDHAIELAISDANFFFSAIPARTA